MKIIISQNIGFCFGVSNSVNKTLDLLKNNNQIYCYGELVHNENVNKALKGNGLTIVNDLNNIDNNKKVIIRAHGISKNDYEVIQKKNLDYFDFTCKKVLAIHKLAQKLAKENYFIILIAHKNHPETIGTISFCGNNSIVIDSIDDIKKLNTNLSKIAVISQTTYSIDKFNLLVDALKKFFYNINEIKIFNTICKATIQRQEEIKQIINNVDSVIVIGGKNSSNTKKLYDIAKQNCPDSILIENKDELKNYILTLKHRKKMGIISGTSTPKNDVDNVINYLKNYEKVLDLQDKT